MRKTTPAVPEKVTYCACDKCGTISEMDNGYDRRIIRGEYCEYSSGTEGEQIKTNKTLDLCTKCTWLFEEFLEAKKAASDKAFEDFKERMQRKA
jgi:protein-arginine kinase activator protein McsA